MHARAPRDHAPRGAVAQAQLRHRGAHEEERLVLGVFPGGCGIGGEGGVEGGGGGGGDEHERVGVLERGGDEAHLSLGRGGRGGVGVGAGAAVGPCVVVGACAGGGAGAVWGVECEWLWLLLSFVGAEV